MEDKTLLDAIRAIVKEETVPINIRLDNVDSRLGGIDSRLDGVDSRLDGVDSRLGGIDSRHDGVDSRLDSMQEDINELKAETQKISGSLAVIEVDHGNRLKAIYDAHVDTVRNATTIKELDAKVDDHDNRIFAIEQHLKAQR